MNPSYSPNDDAAPTLVDTVAQTVAQQVAQTVPAFSRLASEAEQMTRRSVETVRDQALRAGESTRGYIKDEPVKSVLIAAAVGAALMALVALIGRAAGARA